MAIHQNPEGYLRVQGGKSEFDSIVEELSRGPKRIDSFTQFYRIESVQNLRKYRRLSPDSNSVNINTINPKTFHNPEGFLFIKNAGESHGIISLNMLIPISPV